MIIADLADDDALLLNWFCGLFAMLYQHVTQRVTR